jgi:Glucose inhibited division protein A
MSAAGIPHIPEVIVVGAGVSGCACAATLAAAGHRVTLINSAMDRVGLPAYGPDLIAEDGDRSSLEECLKALPAPLEAVWLEAAMTPAGGEPVLNVDRRRISIETKRILEQLPGLHFRQGFVTDVRLLDDGLSRVSESPDGGEPVGCFSSPRAQVETIFGEVFEASALVIAVGMSMGGSIAAGDDVMPGGRYGEPASEGVRQALESLGIGFRDVFLEVGARTSGRSAVVRGWVSAPGEDGAKGTEVGEPGLSELALLPALVEQSSAGWPKDYPPAAHWQAELRLDRIVMQHEAPCRKTETSRCPGGAALRPALSPDGAATAEVYIAPGSALAGEATAMSEEAAIATRVPLVVQARAVTGLGDAGRAWVEGRPLPLWVIGRASGAADYVASLSSGVRAAVDIASVLDGREAGV